HAQPIDVALREHGAQPCREAAAALKVLKQRSALAAAVPDAVELGVQRVGELSRAAARIERVSGAVQHGPVLEDETLPGLRVSCGAQARELQVRRVRRSGHDKHYRPMAYDWRRATDDLRLASDDLRLATDDLRLATDD